MRAQPSSSQMRTVAASTDMMEGAAATMVPAEADLRRNIDARKVQPGSDFSAVLTQSARLKNGSDLPRGTTLIGQVEQDKSQPDGGTVLALRFTSARLKDGQQIPIRATIVNVAPPVASDSYGADSGQMASPWDGKTLQFDQIGVESGAELHSRIAGGNSGTFVSSKKDVRLVNGSQLTLAIGTYRKVS